MTKLLRSLAAFLFVWLLALPALATPPAEKSSVSASAEAPLIVFNRTVFTFRADFLGSSPATRAQRARQNIADAVQQGGELRVQAKDDSQDKVILLGSSAVFVITPGDVDPLARQSIDDLSQQTVQRLERVIAETGEARNVEALIKALGLSALATLVFGALLWAISRLHTLLATRILGMAERKAATLTIGGTRIIDGSHLMPAIQRLFNFFRWLVIALLSYEWISFLLSRFPYTRPWGEQLNDYLLGIADSLLGGIIGAIPGLGVVVAIFLIARFSTNFLARLLERLAQGQSGIGWLAKDTLPTTRRLLSIAIWLFAVAMAYPYLPGAQTEAFRGLSVLLGVMVSLGASSIVGQGAAGLILTYTRTIRAGEYVHIGEHEGTVTEMGFFTTTIRTGLGEELNIPNALITGAVTKNYSRAVQGHGYVIDTTVTIGYDTPWRQVEAMLIEAAQRTPGILTTPAPRVFQTALSDYYPEYRLVAQAIPSAPRPRAEVLSLLHANIQDVFNRYGVQIMSPHYMDDTAAAKVVKPEDWYPAPANRDAS